MAETQRKATKLRKPDKKPMSSALSAQKSKIQQEKNPKENRRTPRHPGNKTNTTNKSSKTLFSKYLGIKTNNLRINTDNYDGDGDQKQQKRSNSSGNRNTRNQNLTGYSKRFSEKQTVEGRKKRSSLNTEAHEQEQQNPKYLRKSAKRTHKQYGNQELFPKTKPVFKKATPLHLENNDIRLNRFLSIAGITARRKADILIKEGKVKVNGQTITDFGFKINWKKDKVEAEGHLLEIPASIYIMVNKPFGYISALKDPEGRPVVTELVAELGQRVFPVGRLDFDSIGLLLLTNDGSWSNKFTHPRYEVPRTYKVTIAGEFRQEHIEQIRDGMPLDKEVTAPAKAEIVNISSARSVLRITIRQGINRQVRRMFEALGYRVIQLIRIGFGPLQLGDLKPGEYRLLTEKELLEFDDTMNNKKDIVRKKHYRK